MAVGSGGPPGLRRCCCLATTIVVFFSLSLFSSSTRKGGSSSLQHSTFYFHRASKIAGRLRCKNNKHKEDDAPPPRRPIDNQPSSPPQWSTAKYNVHGRSGIGNFHRRIISAIVYHRCSRRDCNEVGEWSHRRQFVLCRVSINNINRTKDIFVYNIYLVLLWMPFLVGGFKRWLGW